MKQEVYKSSTLGDISLSFEGRRLMQNLREAVTQAIDEAAANGQYNWRPVSEARGRIAQYMSKLEQRNGVTSLSEVIAENHRLKQILNSQAFKLSEAEKTSTANTISVHLPPIPPGYELHVIGSSPYLISIEPIGERRYREG